MSKIYICECKREFTNSQSFNAHKSHCEIHFKSKGKDLKIVEQKRVSAAAKQRKINLIKRKAEKLSTWISEKHKCENCGNEMIEYYGSGRFCSESCARAFSTNQNRDKINNKVSETFHEKSIKSKTLLEEKYNQNPNRCVICNNVLSFELRDRKTCSDVCLHELRHRKGIEVAKNSMSNTHKRSKNEIAFCEKCEEYFGKENVLHNEPMFNGWDADIILPQYKLAILWNGPWHYVKMNQFHSVEQARTRDKIKIKEIQNYGYTPYIIKDMGKYDQNKVEIEFQLLLTFLNIK